MSVFDSIGAVCANCGSENIDYDLMEFGNLGETLIYPYTCVDCGKSGKEFYQVTFLENVIDMEEDNE